MLVNDYEAVVVTSDGTFRAFPVTKTKICIVEDGVPGVIDFLDALPGQCEPREITPLLLTYIFERYRGLSIVSATLGRRKFG